MKLSGYSFALVLSCASASYAMCTGEVIDSPVILASGEMSDYYNIGDIIWNITQASVEDGEVFLCIWSGPCVSGDDVHLRKVIKVHGDTNLMSAMEIRENSYESNESCSLKYLMSN